MVAGSGRGTLVMMMHATDLGDLDDTTAARWMNCPVLGTIHLKGLMNSRAMLVAAIAGQDLPQMFLVQHYHMVEAFSPDASDQPFDIRIGVTRRLHPMSPLRHDVSTSPIRFIHWSVRSSSSLRIATIGARTASTTTTATAS